MFKENTYIRKLQKSDLPQIKIIIDDNQMFPSEYLVEMTDTFFHHETEEQWFVTEKPNGEVLSVVYCVPERMTEGTWNLLLIAVLKRYQGLGLGRDLLFFIETKLKQDNARVLLVETSGLPNFELTRKFYVKCGYKQVALIPEYYDSGDDKVVFWKSLVR